MEFMTCYLGQADVNELSVHSLDNWTAEAHPVVIDKFAETTLLFQTYLQIYPSDAPEF